MLGFIISPELANDIHESMSNHHILFEKSGVFDPDDFIQHCQAAANLTLDVFIIDLDSSSDDAVVKGIRRFRLKNNARILLIAPGRVPGDPTISQLVNLGVWDIIAPELPTDEDEDENYKARSILIAELIQKQLAMKYVYGNAARWDVAYETEQKEQKSYDIKEKVIYQENVIFQDRIVGTVVIGVGGVGRRTGTTHSTIQLSLFLQKQGYKVACVELLDSSIHFPAFYTLHPEAGTNKSFSIKGIDFYPNADLDKYIHVISSQYEYVIVDFGHIFINSKNTMIPYANEFLRSHMQIITATPALWDVSNILNTIDTLRQIPFSRDLYFIVNLTDDRTFKEFSKMFSKNEKASLRLSFSQTSFTPDPFQLSENNQIVLQKLLSPLMPNREKRRFLFRPFKQQL